MNKQHTLAHYCAYCGMQRPLTREHVIPRCLFPTPPPPNLVTVPVCSPCNNQKSRNDDFLRDMLVADVRCCHHPVAQSLFHKKSMSSARKGKSLFARTALQNANWGPAYTTGGIYVGDFHRIQLDGQRLIRIYSGLVRGLYYAVYKKRLPDNTIFECGRCERWHADEIARDMLENGCGRPIILGNVFGCAHLWTDNPFMTYWLLSFYAGMFVTVETSSP